MRSTIIHILIICLTVNILSAQNHSVSDLTEESINKRIIGLWGQSIYKNEFWTLKKQRTEDEKELGDYIKIEADGNLESHYTMINIKGDRFRINEYSTWKYNHEKKTLELTAVQEEGSQKNQWLLWQVSDSTIVMSNPGIVRSENVFEFSDFQKIENFIRYYGLRKSYDRWQNNPYFRFPFGEVYLCPYGENPRAYDIDDMYEYFGFHSLNDDGTSIKMTYNTTAYIKIGEQNEDSVKSFAKHLLQFCEAYPYETFENKKMTNEGEFNLISSDPRSKSKLEIRLLPENAKGADLSAYPSHQVHQHEMSQLEIKLLDITFPDQKYSIATYNYIITYIKPVIIHSLHKNETTGERYGKQHYSYDLTISTKEKTTYNGNISFFNGRGIIEEIWENGVVKVRMNWGAGLEMMPTTYTYVLKMK